MEKRPDRYFSVTTPLDSGTLTLRSFSGEESISGLFRFTLEMVSDEAALDFARIVAEPATITIELEGGGRRHVNGIVGRFAQGGRTARGRTIYLAELYPALWLLTRSSDCRIFQEKTTPEIVAQVLEEHGLSFTSRLSGDYEPREFCVQYNETDFAFVSRLLEEEGIFYYFEHSAEAHDLVLGDDSAAIEPCPGCDELTHGASGEGVQESAVAACTLEETVVPARVGLDDFNFETPSTDLTASFTSTAGGQGELRQFPGGYSEKGDGESLARIRVEEQTAPRVLLRGESRAPALLSGHSFALAGHYRDDLNGTYVVGRLTHEARRTGYTNSFEALPRTVTYRPPRRTPRPVIAGTQTAIVVGPAGEEIWTDRYGRVKVQFHWDAQGKKDDGSSCWIRVSQAWAGKSWGQLYLPRIGQEVIVSFEEGDPDRPIITGRVYNAEQTVPQALPDEKTRSTIKSCSSRGGGGSNELRFEDRKGDEEVYLHAERDLRIAVGENESVTVGEDRCVTVGRRLTIDAGSEITLVAGNARIEMKDGSITFSGTNINLSASAQMSLEGSAGAQLKAGATLVLKGSLVEIN